MEKSYIKSMDYMYLESIGINKEQLNEISSMIQIAINENLYTNTLDFKHDLKHIERVMIYVQWIINEKEKNGEIVENQNLLKLAVLYHDIGKSINASNELHGVIGSQEFRKKKQGILDKKYIDKICVLIETHASENDAVYMDGISDKELENLQILSDILKDADALDRNRLNYPAPIGTCDEKKLRTTESKKILKDSDTLLKEYMDSYIREKEKNSNAKIMNNYEKLKIWLDEYESGVNNIYHASLDPTIEKLIPQESTQAGRYVYADVDPVHCTKMAAFRLSMLFKRERDPITGKSIILDVFPGTVHKTLQDKYITIYKLPKESFKKYETEVTSAKSGEYVSDLAVIPEEQITFPALDYFKYLSNNNKFKIVENSDETKKVESLLDCLQIYIWNIKKETKDPQIFEKSYGMIRTLIEHYSPQYVKAIERTRLEVDKLIVKEKEKYKLEHGRPISITDDNEDFLKVLISKFLKRYQNKEYIDEIITNSVKEEDEKQNGIEKERQSLLEQKRKIVRQQLLEQKNNLGQQKAESINQDNGMTRKLVPNTTPQNSTNKNGFTNVLILSIITSGFVVLVALLTSLFIK